MDILELTDKLWFKIAPLFTYISNVLGIIFYPFLLLGPVVGIACIALATYGLVTILSKIYNPKNIKELQEKFKKLQEEKKEASKVDRDIAKAFDDELDKVYFELLWASIIRSSAVYSIPTLGMLCWVWSYLSPEKLQKMYGKSYVIKLPFKMGVIDNLGSAGWFLICLFFVWCIHVEVIDRLVQKKVHKNKKTSTR